MPFFEIPPDTRAKQHQASNPNHSVWVSANAGSGKTHVLAQRVVRLLLQGVAPSKILCLTFTKAAAANMASRVFDTLADWTRAEDDELAKMILAIGAPAPDRQGLTVARKLFARTVETPGGLKIQTIHAFCERLLHLFPFEANVPARFEVPDELRQVELLHWARRDVLAEANSGRSGLAAAVQRVAEECGAQGFEDLIQEAMTHRAMARAGVELQSAESLRQALGLAKGEGAVQIESEMIEDGLAPKRWSDLADMLHEGNINDKKKADLLRRAGSAYSKGQLEDCLACYLSVFFTEGGKGSKTQKLLTNSLAAKYPEMSAELSDEQDRLEPLRIRHKAAATFERTCALTEIAAAIFKRYHMEKAAGGLLDFDDLVEKTLALLERSDARWVLYKLDAGIDHILVDEAQDTSESQWQILEKLTEDFTAGWGRSSASRTFFAVGDEKQSIFSFQGAAPHMFAEMRRRFQTRFTAGAQSFTHVPLTLSFRSVSGVLSAVDRVFSRREYRIGLVAANDVWMPHEALKHQLPGLIEVWPAVSPQEREDRRDWTLPLDILDPQDPPSLVAKRIAQKIADLMAPGSGEYVHDGQTGRPRNISAGDILILVRSRGPFFEAMIRALKRKGIRTAGADRLEIASHIAVIDLVAAGRVARLPQDDLTLACVLKSPLIGLDDEDLLRFAPGRAGSLFDALKGSLDPRHVEAARKIAIWQARGADNPFAFYSRLLSADGGRRALEARLGPEAGDAIDEFLQLALAHESETSPALATFLDAVAGMECSIKRDMESGNDAVRVMTVHAAKGLEAKIVFLPDSCRAPSPAHDPCIFALPTRVPGRKLIAWSPKKDLDCAAVALAREESRQAAAEEYRRLLYVALTRAEERLYVAGFHGTRGRDAGCWAEMIEETLGEEPGFVSMPAFWNGEEQISRCVCEPSGGPDLVPMLKEMPSNIIPGVPDWLSRPVAFEKDVKPPVRPSNALAAADHLEGGSLSKGRCEALRWGRLLHALLQYLPGVAAPHRQAKAMDFLLARAPDLAEAVRQSLAGEALNVLNTPSLAALFGETSKAEVSVIGTVKLAEGRSIDVLGQVDRIGETASEILVADYKTGTPCALAETPHAYLAQMALYRAVLAPLWPEKRLRMLLIWTAGPLVVTLPGELLDDVLKALNSKADVA